METAKPSLELLRSLSDEHVLRGLMRHRRLTRAELATATGLSKPTVSESVRRLTGHGLLVDTGERTPGGRGRGRVGSYYALAADAGTALAVSIGPEGIVAETVDAHGDTVTRAHRPVARAARADQVADALRAVVGSPARPRLAVVSAADPVDRTTGRLIELPDSPFLLGELDPVEILAPYVTGPVTVDNDVNWAARAELEHAPANFAYLFLGEGLGCAIVSDGEVRRGAGGLAGEIAHLVTTGPGGRAMRLTEVFAELGLRRPGSTAIDVDRLLADADAFAALGTAVTGVLAALVALADPGLVVMGGSWGSDPAVLAAITGAFAGEPRHVPLRAATITAGPSLAGARIDAVERLRAAVVAAASPAVPSTSPAVPATSPAVPATLSAVPAHDG
ncbi:ROK family transcriptional regulator [Micromonosporaceae bacterium Da 78-11]